MNKALQRRHLPVPHSQGRKRTNKFGHNIVRLYAHDEDAGDAVPSSVLPTLLPLSFALPYNGTSRAGSDALQDLSPSREPLS